MAGSTSASARAGTCNLTDLTTAGPILSLVSLVLLAAGVLFQFFVVLSGGVDGSPEPNFWFLAADTSNIPGAPAVSTWTFFSLCGFNGPLSSGGQYANCRGATAALPYDFQSNFGANPQAIG